MIKILVILFIYFVSVETKLKNLKDFADNEIEKEFFSFLVKYNKKYDSPEEYLHKFANFRNNYNKLKLKISQNTNLTCEVTKFFDLSEEEFKTAYLTLKVGNITLLKEQLHSISYDSISYIPSSFDWRDKGVVSKVKNQFACGSCWTFSTTGNLEAQYNIKYNQTILLSEQQLIDCDKNDYGCRGGYMENAFKYIKDVGGLETESDYYYKGFDDECSFNSQLVKVKVKDYEIAKTEDEEEIMKILFQKGPLSIGLNGYGLEGYTKGIIDFQDADDCPSVINHAVLLVGYGIENDMKFWIIKNSWGEDWGEKGYFRIVRGKGACGLNKYILTGQIE